MVKAKLYTSKGYKNVSENSAVDNSLIVFLLNRLLHNEKIMSLEPSAEVTIRQNILILSLFH